MENNDKINKCFLQYINDKFELTMYVHQTNVY